MSSAEPFLVVFPNREDEPVVPPNAAAVEGAFVCPKIPKDILGAVAADFEGSGRVMLVDDPKVRFGEVALDPGGLRFKKVPPADNFGGSAVDFAKGFPKVEVAVEDPKGAVGVVVLPNPNEVFDSCEGFNSGRPLLVSGFPTVVLDVPKIDFCEG